MNFSKPKKATPNKPIIRRTTVKVPVQTLSTKLPARGPDPNRFQQALDRPGAKTSASNKTPIAARRAISSVRGAKRKSATPQRTGPLFSDDEDENSSDLGASDSDASARKRIKSSDSGLHSSHGPRRHVVCEKAFEAKDTISASNSFVHGADATSGEYSSKFKNPWQDEYFETVELQYPSGIHKERFELKFPKNEKEDYKPMEDIIETIKTICTHYFPEKASLQGLDQDHGYERRFEHAWNRKDIDEFKVIVNDFNKVLKGLIDDGSVLQVLRNTSSLDLNWVRRILEQIYARTVSPKVEKLRAYENGSDNVYGELLPRFCSEIFKKTRLNHEQIFIDLGSGVGNVVLQAALEVGCQSWGIEMMKNPCDLAEMQQNEFPARTRLWGLSAGEVKLLRADFTESPEIDEVLRRADVILVNNQAFTPQLNRRLLDKFLDLKEGAQIVSLRPFVPDGHKITARTAGDTVNYYVQQRFEYFSNSVSWTDQSGYYYIATKDRRPLDAFFKKNKLH